MYHNNFRPVIIGFDNINKKQIGKINIPYKCFDPCFEIYDENEILKFKILAKYCQWGICCPSFGKCSSTKFFIYDGQSSSSNRDESVGSIIRVVPGMATGMFTDADSFDIEFPPNATPNEKLMILGATFMIDLIYFESHGDSTIHDNCY